MPGARFCRPAALFRPEGFMSTRLRCLLLTITAMAAAAPMAVAQPTPAASRAAQAPLTEIIAVDPQVRAGRLHNGLQYFVRANAQPRGRAELRLVVNAGSVLEDDDQRGLAHFVEHMSFNGTRHFPGQDVAAFIQALGMRFGAHVNARTSFDETVYQLQIPTDSGAVVDRSLLIMEDWAHNVSFDPAEIEKERGVVLEEWRLGLGAESRLRDAQMPILLKGARYADRSPIGRPEIIRNVSPARLRQFYADWYRPDLMAVIAVGDFDPAAINARSGPIGNRWSNVCSPACCRRGSTKSPMGRTRHSWRRRPTGDSSSAPRWSRPSRLWFQTAVRSVGLRLSSLRPNGSSDTVSRRPSSTGKSSIVSATSTRPSSRKTRVHRVRSPTNWCATWFRTNPFPASSTNRRCRNGSCRKLRSPKSDR